MFSSEPSHLLLLPRYLPAPLHHIMACVVWPFFFLLTSLPCPAVPCRALPRPAVAFTARFLWFASDKNYGNPPGNGFRFQRPSDGEAEQKVVEYAFKALDALGVKYGPTHTGESCDVLQYAPRYPCCAC